MAADASIQRSSGRQLDRWIIGVLGLAVVLLLANQFVQRKPAAARAAAGSASSDKSIAVLPFENLSDDKANAYFAQGIQDEILTRLAKIGALRVISRTSTARYASSPGNLPEIAKRLSVENILEGSVQKLGNAVRINVQLIRASSDDHLWAETYERKLDNVFGVEGEVAQAIADTLNARLTGAEHQAMGQAPTRNPQAYDAYLRGLAFEVRYSNHDDVLDAARFFGDAVKLDPEFALAWAHLSIAHSFIFLNGYDHTPRRLADLREATDTAMKLQPELGEAWLARGYYLYRGLDDYDGALSAFEQASRRLPNSSEVSAAIAYVQRRQGNWNEALAQLQASTRRDPQNISYWTGTAEVEAALHRYPEAQAALDRALEFAASTATVGLRAQKVAVYQAQGDLDAAQKLLDELPSDPHDLNVTPSRGTQMFYRRQFGPLIALMHQLLGKPDLALGDQLPGFYSLQGAAQLFGGDPAAARLTFATARRVALDLRKSGVDTSNLASSLGLIEAALGNRAAASKEAQRGVSLAGADRWIRAAAETTLAQIAAVSGDTEPALAALPALIKAPGGVSPGDLRFNPIWDKLRGDPRFQKLIAEGEVQTPAKAQ